MSRHLIFRGLLEAEVCLWARDPAESYPQANRELLCTKSVLLAPRGTGTGGFWELQDLSLSLVSGLGPDIVDCEVYVAPSYSKTHWKRWGLRPASPGDRRTAERPRELSRDNSSRGDPPQGGRSDHHL